MVLVIVSVNGITGLVCYATNTSGLVNFTQRCFCSFSITAAGREGNTATDAMVTHSKRAVTNKIWSRESTIKQHIYRMRLMASAYLSLLLIKLFINWLISIKRGMNGMPLGASAINKINMEAV
jgi:hypothetical protein